MRAHPPDDEIGVEEKHDNPTELGRVEALTERQRKRCSRNERETSTVEPRRDECGGISNLRIGYHAVSQRPQRPKEQDRAAAFKALITNGC